MRLSAPDFSTGLIAAALSLLASASVTAAPAMPGFVTAEPAVEAAAPRHLWSSGAIAELEAEARAAAAEGLDPAAYDLAGLAAAASAGEGPAADRAATAVALSLARDYAEGRVTDRARFDWHIEGGIDPARLAADLDAAIRANRARPWLRSLLPQDSRYAALRAALAATPAEDSATRMRIRANLERWRWMPRDLGQDHILVNVPSYSLELVEDGQAVSTYTVVVGKPATPTPQIAVEAQSIVVNPWWNVPRSISSKMSPAKAKGFDKVAGGGLRQRPGPGNALGKVKIDMPNPQAIYLHDTPSKALFAEVSRAFSHGCIRVKDIDRLASELAELDSGDGRAVRAALASSATRTVPLQHKRPVYLVYFTAQAGPDGKITAYDDPYGRDRHVVEALDGATRLAVRQQQTSRG